VQAKITQIRDVSGADKGSLSAGEIGVVYGVGQMKVGQVIGNGEALPRKVRPGALRTPLMTVRAVPDRPEQLNALTAACVALAEEDPLLRTRYVPATGELQLEAMGGIHNILPLVIAATAAFLLAELSGVEDFTDAVIQAKERAARKGKPEILVLPLTVEADSFAAGKKLWDILWPNDCVVVSVEHADEGHSGEELRPGDVITLRCRTHSPDDTAKELTALCGRGN